MQKVPSVLGVELLMEQCEEICTVVDLCALQINGGHQTAEDTIPSPLTSVTGLIDLI